MVSNQLENQQGISEDITVNTSAGNFPLPPAPTNQTNVYYKRMSSTSDEYFLGFEKNETRSNRWQVVRTTSTKNN